ncbi:MAG: histidine kinase [Bacteroidetes bacterium]|nr:histidine kinase [Bacteroidota bacterium]
MISRIFKNELISVYFLVWTAVAVVHFFLLYQLYHLQLLPSLLDSLLFNIIFSLFGIGFWFMVEYSGTQNLTQTDSIIQHSTLCAISVTIWIGAGNFLLKSMLSDHLVYLSFLSNTLTFRIFLGIMYYGMMISVFYLVVSYRQLREKREYESLLTTQLREAELTMLRSQIRPHFLFNSLNSISALTLNDPGKAHEMIIKLSDFMRYSLTFQGESMSTLEKELYHIKLYLDIEKIRFGPKLMIDYQIDEDCLQWPVPSMILQPIIENAVKYGVYEATSASEISVTARLTMPTLMLLSVSNVVDPDIVTRKGTGTGLKNVERRLETIYKQRDLIKTYNKDNRFFAQLYMPSNG